MNTKIFPLFVLLMLILVTSVSAQTILHIGDSHTSISTYGPTLYNLLNQGGNTVRSYSVGGSSPVTWYLGTCKGIGTGEGNCKLMIIDRTGKKTQQFTGTQLNPYSLEKLKSQFNPDKIVITLGTNILVNDAYVLKLAQVASSEGTKCYWVGPPQIDPNKKSNINGVSEYIKSKVSSYCNYIDSLPISEASKLSDGIHYGDQGGTEWAQNVYNQLISNGLSSGTGGAVAALSSTGKILNLGDSHTAGTYGNELYDLLKNTGAEVTSYGCVGAAPSHYLNGGKKCINENQGSNINKIRQDYDLPQIDQLLRSKPSLVIVSLGANFFYTDQSNGEIKLTLDPIIQSAVSEMTKKISASGAKCLWVGPPSGSNKPVEQLNHLYELISKNLGNCVFFDSREYLADGSGGHFQTNSPIAKAWGQAVFNHLSASGFISPSAARGAEQAAVQVGVVGASSGTSVVSSCTTSTCTEVDEVWASISNIVGGPESKGKIFDPVGGWVSRTTMPVATNIPSETSLTDVPKSREEYCGVASFGSPEIRALLDTIAWAEGGKSYNTRYGGKTFTDLSTHPYFNENENKVTPKPIAAGRYQFMYYTYKNLKDKGLAFQTGFYPGEQDQAAAYSISLRGVNEKDVINAINSGDFTSLWDRLSKEWAAIPYSKSDCTSPGCGNGKSYYGEKQAERTATELSSLFEKCYEAQKAKT